MINFLFRPNVVEGDKATALIGKCVFVSVMFVRMGCVDLVFLRMLPNNDERLWTDCIKESYLLSGNPFKSVRNLQ